MPTLLLQLQVFEVENIVYLAWETEKYSLIGLVV